MRPIMLPSNDNDDIAFKRTPEAIGRYGWLISTLLLLAESVTSWKYLRFGVMKFNTTHHRNP